MISGEVLKYLNRFLLAIPENYENLFDPSSFSDNTRNTALCLRADVIRLKPPADALASILEVFALAPPDNTLLL
jgi:hypothetical protein